MLLWLVNIDFAGGGATVPRGKPMARVRHKKRMEDRIKKDDEEILMIIETALNQGIIE